jgi:phosphonate transport system substrate-binding protein
VRKLLLAAVGVALTLSGCGSSTSRPPDAAAGDRVLTLGAIPDQDPEQLARLHPVVARDLSRRLGVRVVYRPVTDYAAAVTAFRTGDLDLVWFGGLTGVQALHQVPGARALAQRDIDARFRSVFIASRRSGIEPVKEMRGLRALRGRRFTFGSESSTSGRLMPEYFMRRAGVREDDLRGGPGFSGSHDKTIALVSSGSYDAGALNEQVWRDRLAAGEVDEGRVRVVYRTPTYHDYFWAARPDLDRRLGAGFTERLRGALLGMRDPRALELFGAQRFIPVGPDDHRQVRAIARELGLLGAAGA